LVDISDPTVWSTIVQTIVLSLTLVIFTLSFRSQNKAIQEQAYQKVMDDYGDAMRMLSERPELYAFQLELFNISGRPFGREQKSYSREEMVIRNYVIMLYGFFERIHFLYRRKWIDEDTWKQWQRFLKLLPHTPFSGTFISPLEKCSTSHSKTTSLESSAARNETGSLAPGIASDSLGGSPFCDILYEFNDYICLGKQALLCVAESFSSRRSANRLEMVERACLTTSRLMQSIHYSSSYSTF